MRVLLLLLLRLTFHRAPPLRRAAASATPLAPPRGLRFARGALGLLLRRVLPLLLLRRTGTLRPRRTPVALGTLSLRLPLLRLLLAGAAALPSSGLALAALRLLAIATLHALAGALLELAHLALQKTRGLPVLPEAHLVVPAVRTALPAFGVGLFTGVAEDAFRQRHREIGAHCTLRAVDESRRRTLLALIHLAEENSPSACWDDRRAMELLRKEATRDELRELGVDERMIEHIFTEQHA